MEWMRTISGQLDGERNEIMVVMLMQPDDILKVQLLLLR